MTAPTVHGFALFETPIGACGVAWSSRGIVGLQLPEATAEQTRARLRRRWTRAKETSPPPDVQRAIDQVLALLGGEAVELGGIALDLEAASEFHRKVYDVARS